MFRVFTAIALLCATACGPQIRTTYIGPRQPPRPATAEVRVWSVGVPECPFEELGLVTVVEGDFSGSDGFIDTLKDEARAMGGDALVGVRDFYKAVGDGGSWGLSATVVRFTDRACTEPTGFP